MKKIREIIRIKLESPNFSNRQIARALNISHPVVSRYLTDCKKSEHTLRELIKLNDDDLINALQGENTHHNHRYQYLKERFAYYHTELKKKYVTLQRLWEEYRDKAEGPYSYTQFTYHYQMWKNTLPVSMHMEHKAGDKLFIDFAGKKLHITDRKSGKQKPVEIFVGTLGCSQLTYFEAVENQKKENFVQATVNCLRYVGGVPNAIVPDCLKSGVTKSDRYEPVINPVFQQMAEYYHTVILPARPLKPKDKALVEGAVKIVYQWVYAALRDRIFYSLEELNQALRKEMKKYNGRSMQKLGKSRREMYEAVEKEALKALPSDDYEIKRVNKCTIQFNYHAYLSEDKHYYSVPYRYIKKEVEIHYTGRNVEIYHNNERIAFHVRSRIPNGYSTLKEHMPSTHQFVASWSREKFIKYGNEIGPSVGNMCARIMDQRKHPEQGFRACMGILSLKKKYNPTRINNACRLALESGEQSVRRVKMILDNKLDIDKQKQKEENQQLPAHENLRGNKYYTQEMKL